MLDHATALSLREFPDRLAALYDAFPSAFANWQPDSWEGVPSEPFSALAQLCHVRDIERDGYHVRIQRTLQEHHPTLVGLDGERLAVERRYAEEDASTVLASFRQARAATLAMLTELSPEQWRRTAFFEDYGEVTLRGLLHYLSSHDQQHVAGLQWLLGKIEGSRHTTKK